jgi:hypothetical protein
LISESNVTHAFRFLYSQEINMRNLSLVIPHAQTCALRPEECVVAAALNDELSQLFIATSSNDILLLSTSFAEDCGKQVRAVASPLVLTDMLFALVHRGELFS